MNYINFTNLKIPSEIFVFSFILLTLNIVCVIYNSYYQKNLNLETDYYSKFNNKMDNFNDNNIIKFFSYCNFDKKINSKNLKYIDNSKKLSKEKNFKEKNLEDSNFKEEINSKNLKDIENNISIPKEKNFEDSNIILNEMNENFTSNIKYFDKINNQIKYQITFGDYQTYEENKNDINTLNLKDNNILSEILSVDDINNISEINVNSEVDFADFENNIIYNYNETLKNNNDNCLKGAINIKKETNFILPFDLDNNSKKGEMKEEKLEDNYDPNDDFIIINKDTLISL